MFSNWQCISLRSSSGSGAGTTFLLVGDFDLASGIENTPFRPLAHPEFFLGGGVADPDVCMCVCDLYFISETML
jgi:hypothetical protein